VKTKWINRKFKPVAWDGHDTAHPDERTIDAEGMGSFPHRPRGYCTYAPA
jgi:alpha-amylase